MFMGTIAIYACILISGVLQAFGNPMNSQLKNSLQNPWLTSFVSFVLIVPIFLIAFSIQPRPLPSAENIAMMPWWAPLGGIVGAVAVFAGLVFVGRVGAGVVAGLLITANLLTSLVIDHFGWFNMDQHPLGPGRIIGGILMVAGVISISFF
jgi:bacterial/archaeal transporter family-2 protein